MRSLLLVPLAFLAGCHLVFPHAPGGDAGRRDEAHLPVLDLAANGLRPGCVTADASTLALYTFDDSSLLHADRTGKHPIATSVGLVEAAPGAPGCGGGVHIASREDLPSYLVIDHHPDWDEILAIELWVRFDREPPAKLEAILSRDAFEQAEPGHFTLFRDCHGQLFFRLQQLTSEVLVCSAVAPPKDTWTHVLVNFEPPELRVDGTLAPGSTSSCGLSWLTTSCSSPSDRLGIAGNKNPWVVGASLLSATPGTTDAVDSGLTGTIDELRFSATRR